jgi:hypothetical protein
VAETSSGWLKPGDLSKGAASRRALRLLGEYLNEDQQEQAERHGGFLLYDGDRHFWIPLDGSPWCAFAGDGRVDHFCVAPDKRVGMPEGDVALTYLLWIKFDPDGFLREANVLSSKMIETWPDSEAELVRMLAEIARPPSLRRPRPRKTKDVKPVKRPELHLDVEQVRGIFERHGKALSNDVLRKLTK